MLWFMGGPQVKTLKISETTALNTLFLGSANKYIGSFNVNNIIGRIIRFLI